MILINPNPNSGAPNIRWSHRKLVQHLDAYAAGNAKLAQLLQQQDFAARFAQSEIKTLRDHLSSGIITMPWHKPIIAALDKLSRILAGQEPIPTLTIPCHACAATMTVPNIGPTPAGAVPLCMDCANLTRATQAALDAAPLPRKAAILERYSLDNTNAIANLQKPAIEAIQKELEKC